MTYPEGIWAEAWEHVIMFTLKPEKPKKNLKLKRTWLRWTTDYLEFFSNGSLSSNYFWIERVTINVRLTLTGYSNKRLIIWNRISLFILLLSLQILIERWANKCAPKTVNTISNYKLISCLLFNYTYFKCTVFIFN